MNEIVPAHTIGAYVPMVDGPEKVSGRAKYTADLIAPGMLAGRIYPQPLFARRDPRSRYFRGAAASRREGDRHRRRLRQDLRSAADRAQRASLGARQGALSRRAGGGGRRRRRRHRQTRARPDQAQGARIAGLLLLAGGDGRRARPISIAHKPNNIERDVLFELGHVEQGFQEADLVREGIYDCAEVCQNQMEMHAAVAEYDRRARAHDGARQHPGPLLRPPDAGADPRHGHVAHPRDQAACRRRLRLPHRGAQRRADRRTAGAPRRRQRAPGDQPRGDLHHPSRPAADRYPPQARHAQGWKNHRRRMRMPSARRRPFRLRRGDDPLFRLDALRHLRPAQRQIYRQARAHQHAALRRLPRPRHRRHPLRLREPARRDGERARARSAGGAARELSHGADLHRQRPDGEQLRPAGMRRLGRAGERLASAQGQAHQGQGSGLCLLALHQRRLQARELDRRAARDRQDQARFRRLHRRALGRRRYRPGLVDHPGADRRRGARARSRRASASSPATARWCRRTTAPIPRA